MSNNRRRQLDDEAIAEIDQLELGLLRPARRPSAREVADQGDRSWKAFAFSYTYAFEVLWDAAYERWPSQILHYPLLYTCRHSAELWIKAALFAVLERPPAPHHDLACLWSYMVAAWEQRSGATVDDAYTQLASRHISVLAALDAKSDVFRYPVPIGAGTYESSYAELEELCRSHSLITGYCDAMCTAINESFV